jgi:hypothetical protein
MAFRSTNRQLSFLERPEVDAAVAAMADSGVEARDAVFTRREVVDFILDLAGYTSDKPLHRSKILEPSMGHSDFLVPVIDRLIESYRREVGVKGDIVADLSNCIVAVELHRASYEETRTAATALLREKGLTAAQSRALCERWLRQSLETLTISVVFDHV